MHWMQVRWRFLPQMQKYGFYKVRHEVGQKTNIDNMANKEYSNYKKIVIQI